MNSINFDRPYLLIVGAVLLIGLFASYFYAVRKDNRSHKNITSFVMHIIMIILIALTMAHTTLERMMTETDIYVVCDLSYSTHLNQDKIDKAISMVEEQSPKNSKIGVIGFGKDPVLHVRCGEMMKSIRTCKVDESETNIAKALEFARSLFEKEVIKRIVLITDGLDTSSSNIVSVVTDLSKDNIYVDAIFIDSNIVNYEEITDSKGNVTSIGEKEVQLSQIDFNQNVYVNSSQVVTGLFNSTSNIQAIIKLYADGVVYKEETVVFNKGINTHSFELDTKTAKTVKYDLVVETSKGDDSLELNNKLSFSQVVSDKLNVLYIGGDKFEKSKAETLFNSKTKVDYYFMEPGENTMEVPCTVEDLCKYDEIVLNNVNVKTIVNDKTFINSLETVVSKYGKSLITLGNTYIGTNVSGDDSENAVNSLDLLSEMLPVKFGNQSSDGRNIAIIIDVSRSMNGENLLTNAKKFVSEFLNTVTEKDSITVIGISENDVPVASRLRGSKENIAKIIEGINQLKPSNGTYIEKGLKRINEEILSDPSIENKEIIVVSDGYEIGNGDDTSLQKYATICKKNGFHITACKVGQIVDTGYNVLKRLASDSNSFHVLFNEFNLKLEDVYENINETKYENINTPLNLKLANDINVKGVELNGSIYGVYVAKPKAGARVVYDVTFDANEKTINTPILAYKYYGNGKVTSITTDIFNTNWGSIFGTTQQGLKLFNNIVTNSIPQVKISSPFIISLQKEGSSNVVEIDCASFQQNAKVSLTVTDSNGNSKKYSPAFDSTKYVCYIDSFEEGNYTLTFDYTFGTKHYVSEAYYYENYPVEYDRFESYKSSNLRKMVLNGEIVNLGEVLNIENTDSKTLLYIYDFTPILMIATVSLFVLDIGLRKLTMKDIKSLFGRGKEESKHA